MEVKACVSGQAGITWNSLSTHVSVHDSRENKEKQTLKEDAGEGAECKAETDPERGVIFPGS